MNDIKKYGASLAAGVVVGLIICYFVRNMDLSSSFSLKGAKS